MYLCITEHNTLASTWNYPEPECVSLYNSKHNTLASTWNYPEPECVSLYNSMSRATEYSVRSLPGTCNAQHELPIKFEHDCNN